jgi:hypothetical protein
VNCSGSWLIQLHCSAGLWSCRSALGGAAEQSYVVTSDVSRTDYSLMMCCLTSRTPSVVSSECWLSINLN